MKGFHLLFLFLAFSGCTALTDPTQTTTVSTYPPPAVSEVSLGPASATLSIRSWLVSPDFVGYVIYTNDDPAVLASIQQDDLNRYSSFSQKTNFAAYVSYSALPTGGQIGSVILSGLTSSRRLYAVVTCLGSNSLLASLRTNHGLIESAPSVAVELAPRPEMSFALTNWYYTNAGSGLLLSGNTMAIDTPSSTWASIASTLVASVESWTGGLYVAFSPGTTSGTTLRVLGGSNAWGLRTPIPSSGYGAAGAPQPVAVGHTCLFRTPSAHVKLMIQGISKTPTLTADFVVITGQVAWQTNLLVTGL